MKSNRSFQFIGSVALPLLTIAPLMAQPLPPEEATSGDDAFLGEITVSATRAPRAVSRTPEQVNVIRPDEIEQLVVQDLEDLLKYETGVDASGGPRRIGQRPSIRGLSGRRVQQRIDGARLNFDSGHKGQAFVDPAWLRQVEIVRGPASALYGSGGLGGTVSMRTIEAADFLRPGDRGGFRLQSGFQGANQEFSIIPTLFGSVGEGTFDVLMTYNGRWSGDLNTGGDFPDLGNSGEAYQSGLGKFVWRPTEFTSVKFGTMTFTGQQVVPPNTSSTGPTLVDRQTIQSVHNLEIQHMNPDTPWLDIGGNFYYTATDITEVQNTDGRLDDVNFDTIGFNIHNRQELPQFSNHLESFLTYGVEYFSDDQTSTRNGAVNGFFPSADSQQLAGYFQGELSVADNLFELIPGVRIDRVSQRGAAGFSNQQTSVNPKLGGILSLDRPLGLRGGYHLSIGGNYAHGFRAPTFSELFASGIHFPGAIFAPSPNLVPERTVNWEVGPRFQVGKFSGMANYFETTARDFIDFNVTFTPPFGPLVFTPVNVTDARLTGVELEGRYDLTDAFALWANYTRVRGDNEVTGAPLTSVSPDRVTVGMDYQLKEYGLFAGVRVSHSSKQDRLPAGNNPSFEFTLVDLLLSWRPGQSNKEVGWLDGLEISAGIDNVFDRGYQPFLSGLPESGINPKASVAYTWRF